MGALELLSGDAQTFIEKVWASRIHVHHARPSDVARLLSLADVDQLLTSSALRTPALRIAQDGEVLPAIRFTRHATIAGSPLTGLVDGRKVLDLFDGGATVVLQGLHRYWPPLGLLIRELEAELGHPCQANAYLTPPGSQGFALHKDTHDVFVFQTHGRKEWELHDDAGAHHVTMEPGVSMYLPTGTPHAARTQRDVSLHVTIGINQVTWRNALGRVVDAVLDAGDLDGHLPAGYLDDQADFAAGLSARLRAIADDLERVDAAAAARTEAERFLTTRTSNLTGGLVDRLAVGEIDADSTVVRRPGSVCVLVSGRDALRVLLGDRELQVPAYLEPALVWLRTQDELRPADLGPWLDPQSSLVLVRRLVREGLLQVRS
ncbi:MAG TPA: cupin domain-containing protein [Nocardioidaceae bacterium]|nr:cupin domain-containing protein [Nocardioidaceae bacterium]